MFTAVAKGGPPEQHGSLPADEKPGEYGIQVNERGLDRDDCLTTSLPLE